MNILVEVSESSWKLEEKVMLRILVHVDAMYVHAGNRPGSLVEAIQCDDFEAGSAPGFRSHDTHHS